MLPVLAFALVDVWAKHTGRRTTSRLLRENKVAAAALLAWGVYHIYLEEYDYGSRD